MPKPLTRNQQLQNLAFLQALGRCGNVRQAAREAEVNESTLYYRRKHHPAFAQRWNATLAVASAALHRAGGVQAAPGRGARARGGEPTVALLQNGRLQVRAARRDSISRACEQRFLLALSATANVSLSAAAAGASPQSFARRRRRNPAFAREVMEAIRRGYEQIEGALIHGWIGDDAEETQWRHNDPPRMPPMNAGQAIQLLYIWHKPVHWRAVEMRRACMPGEMYEHKVERLGRLYRAELFAQAQEVVGNRSVVEEPGPHEPPPLVLPDLATVTGWSRADPTKGGHGPRALFGGWRIADMEAHAAAAERERKEQVARAATADRADMDRRWAELAERHAAAKAERRRQRRRRRT